MHHVRNRERGKCTGLRNLNVRDTAKSRGVNGKEREKLKGVYRKSSIPDVIVIEDDDGDGEVEDYDNETSFRGSPYNLSSCNGLDETELSFDAYELCTSCSEEEDCVVIEPSSSMQASFINRNLAHGGKRFRLSPDAKYQFSRRRSTPSEKSECEIVLDFDGKVKQDWEEAALRRRTTKSRRAESEESTSASVHANIDARKGLKGEDASAPQTQIKDTWKEASRANPSSHAKRNIEDEAFDEQGSSVNVYDVGSDASVEQTFAPQNRFTSVNDLSNVDAKFVKLDGNGASIKVSDRVDDGDSSFNAEKSVKTNDSHAVIDEVVTDREALKRTEAFRHADEEEWARRHLELQKQAEKAQREKKKRKLEADRQIEMEARQKRRLEEIRQSRLKEKQASGFKERIRDRVQSELDHLANTCGDMATLLRRLGVPVEGGAFATDQQVTAAYKKAIRCFHPDRATALAKSDPASQVEAEEKFKLVSRMKSVLPLVSDR